MHAEIVSHKAVAVDGKPVASVEVARQGGDVVILAGREARLVGGSERDNGTCVFYRFHRIGVLVHTRRTCQRIAVDALQLHLRYAREPDVELYSAICCGTAVISAVFVCLDSRNRYRMLLAVLLCGESSCRHNDSNHC